MQLAIDMFPAPRARRRDPHTSHEAAARACRFVSAHHQRVLDGLGKAGGKAGPTRIGWLIDMEPYAVRKRLPELETLGMVRRTGQTVMARSGRREQEWELVPA